MNVTFYFDPTCPFCWITSRWLTAIAPQRDLTINWQPFSLALKTNHLTPKPKESDYAASHRDSHRVLRVIEAAAAAGADRGKLYTDFGRAFHVDGTPYDDTAIMVALGINGLPAELADAADDTSWDAQLAASNEAALNIVGNDVGVPIIVFTRPDGTEAGFFGPVLQALPNDEDSLKLWDGLLQLALIPEFYELKRTRPAGMPDTGSTRGDATPMVC